MMKYIRHDKGRVGDSVISVLSDEVGVMEHWQLTQLCHQEVGCRYVH